MVHRQFAGYSCAAAAAFMSASALGGLSSPYLGTGGTREDGVLLGGFGGGSYATGRFGPRNDGHSSQDGDTVSFGIKMYAASGASAFVNALGNVNHLERGKPFESIGENTNGQIINGSRGNVLAAWDEFTGANSNNVVGIFKSSDGQDLMPLTAKVGNEPAIIWAWNLGVFDPVTWKAGFQTVPLFDAKVSLSRDGGRTFYSTQRLLNLGNEWTGVDPGTSQTDVGVGVNYIKLTYTIGIVPAPGALGAAGVLVAFGARRSRR